VSAKVIASCDCGYVTKASTPTMAAYSLRKHSCDTQRERIARGQRRLDKLALSGPEQPCQHGDRHPHGDRVRYVIDKCRCRPCRDAASAYQRDLERRHLYGKVTYVNADPARAHVASLQAQGMGWKRIAHAADIDTSVMWKLIYGDSTRNMAPSKRIRPATETAILSVTLDLAGGAKIDSIGTTRRIQALVAIGWSQSKIAARLGVTPANFLGLAHGRTGVTAGRAKDVADLYDQLWDQTPPRAGQRDKIAYSRSIRYAALAGWVVPMAWDEDTIDNPDASPDVVGISGALTGRPNKFEIEDIDFILDNDPLTIDQLADRLHVGRDTIEHRLARLDRRDLLARMLRNKTVQEYAA
jgi:transcriptional regulator with XRE-family HTH domain